MQTDLFDECVDKIKVVNRAEQSSSSFEIATFDIIQDKEDDKQDMKATIPKELDTGIYLVPSFNGWLPIPLKNLLQILQSTYDEELLLPQDFSYDP